MNESACLKRFGDALYTARSDKKVRDQVVESLRRVPGTRLELVFEGHIEGDWNPPRLHIFDNRAKLVFHRASDGAIDRSTPYQDISFIGDDCHFDSEALGNHIAALREAWIQEPVPVKGAR
jgi:hypothetical protein